MRLQLYSRLAIYFSGRACQKRLYASQATSEPLRILFCGSDEFSSTSLRALYKEHERDKALIESIDVVCRPAKPVNRGLRDIRDVPIALVAKELALSLHKIDTFTKWKPPAPNGLPINLIVAVSFGLFVPPRILEGARYGGLNVHPSMLPDFHGPAPLHHILLSGCQRSGVTVQTLHPKHFDQGTILAQTPYPGFEHRCSTVPELLTLTSSKGAEMLVQSIINRLYLQPAKSLGSLQDDQVTAPARAAPKINSQDKFIDWNTWTAETIIRRHLAIGPLWSFVRNAEKLRRVIWTTGFRISEETAISTNIPIGQLVVFGNEEHADEQVAYLRTCDDQILRVDRIKIEGGVENPPLRAAKKAGMTDCGTPRQNDSSTRVLLSTDALDGY
ncbi:MAG: Methionyl-tRNA formyltransferase [Alectoria fallacina]|uniref:methionyl-tRNA formyltransferase n=1 Tax=Alectoria fallacina TaxID=1903189 RepID=A0A8H3J672_9LECA|nr:MAG: Methionyl-tRNA formyltransferase [Alectoria fallacina]